MFFINEMPFKSNEAAQHTRVHRQSLILLNFFLIVTSILYSDESFSDLSKVEVLHMKARATIAFNTRF